MKKFEAKNAETTCLELIIAKKKWCILFAYQPPDTNKTNKIYISLIKYLASTATLS